MVVKRVGNRAETNQPRHAGNRRCCFLGLDKVLDVLFDGLTDPGLEACILRCSPEVVKGHPIFQPDEQYIDPILIRGKQARRIEQMLEHLVKRGKCDVRNG